jgi:hypothetical protein
VDDSRVERAAGLTILPAAPEPANGRMAAIIELERTTVRRSQSINFGRRGDSVATDRRHMHNAKTGDLPISYV